MVEQEASISKSFECGRHKKLVTMKTAKKTTPHSYRIICIIFRSIVEISGFDAARILSNNETTKPLRSPNALDLEAVPWMHSQSATR
jgi:hypothetical protein